MADVFLSYAGSDLAKASQVASVLERSGFSVWWEHNLLPGDTWKQAIEQELGAAGCVVVLFSPQSVQSEWVLYEATYGLQRRAVIPVIIEAPLKPPPLFNAIQHVNLATWTGDPVDSEFRRLVDGIGQLVSRRNAQSLSGTSTPSSLQAPQDPTGTVRAVSRRIFICYRREDTQDAAGRLHDRLTDRYGDDSVFMDIDSVPLGIDFVDHVAEQIATCSAVLVMMGRQWLTIQDKRGRTRLELEGDLVRAEIAAALQQKVPVIPVLVQGAEMPSSEELPDTIRFLARRNGIELSAIRWRTDVERLIKELDRVMKG